jgi:hypothetical protein
MTESDLVKFEHKDHKLTDKENLNTIVVQTPLAPVLKETQGGPVYVTVGQHVQFNSTEDVESTNSTDNSLYVY